MASILERLRAASRCFLTDQRGNVLMLFGLAVIPLTFATGMGIDYARAMRLQTKLNAAADAAALAATSAKLAAVQQQYGDLYYLYYANQAAQQMFVMQTKPLTSNGLVINYADATQLTITPTKSANGAYTYTVSYNAESTNAFGSLLKLTSLHIRGTSAASMVLPSYLDIHVALDTSQSMGLAATDADATTLWNETVRVNHRGCQFGCHAVASGEGDTMANDTLAKNVGAKLRIDVLRDAMHDMVTTAQEDQGSKSLYRFQVYRMGQDPTTGAGPTSIYSDIKTSLPNTLTKIDALTLGANSAGGVGDTNLPDMTNFVYPNIQTPGDGSTQAKAKQFFFIITDGVSDVTNGVAGGGANCTYGHCTKPIDPATCKRYKDAGITVGIVYTTYIPTKANPLNPSDPSLRPEYTNLIQKFSWPGYTTSNPSDNSRDIAPALQACASAGWYFEASDGPSIHAAMQKLFQQATQTARLTK